MNIVLVLLAVALILAIVLPVLVVGWRIGWWRTPSGLAERSGLIKAVLTRKSWSIESFICLLLLVLPTGFPLQYLILSKFRVWEDHCVHVGGFGGMRCDLGSYSSAVEGLILALEMGLFLGYSYIWFAANIALLVGLFTSTSNWLRHQS